MDVLDLKSKITLDTDQYQSDLSKTASTTTKTLNEDAKKAAKTSGSSFGSALKSAFTITAGDVINIAKSMWSAISNAADYGDMVNDMSQKMGMSAEAYQEWDAVMQHSGTSMASLQASMKTLSNAAETGSEAFERLGISEEQIASMNSEQLFSAVIAGLQNVESTTERTYLAGQLLGRGATELGVLLNESAESTQAMKDRVHELGGVMNDKAIRASDEFNDKMQDLKTAFSGLGREIITDALPAVNKVVDGLTDAIVLFRDVKNLGWDDAASGFVDIANNFEFYANQVTENQDLINQGYEGAAYMAAEYNRQLANAQKQMDAYLESEQGQAEVLELLSTGELSLSQAAQMAGVSTQEMQRRMRVAADAKRDAARAAEDNAEELSDEEIAAMLAADELANLTRETQYAARGNGDLRAEYEELEKQIAALDGVEDEHLQMLAEEALHTLNLAATNQELTEGYGYYTDVLENAGISVDSLTNYLVDNGISAEEWGSAVTTATNNVINGFQQVGTSLDLSLTEMADNMRANIDAYSNWNSNIDTLMAAAEASGDASAIAFVQHMQEMGIGAADQVAAMVEDVDGTLATFAPLFEEAANQGVLTATDALTDGALTVAEASEETVSEAIDSATETAEAEAPPVGDALDDGVIEGIIRSKARVIAAGQQMMGETISAMKLTAEIKSPSKVMRDEVGTMLGLGIAEGMTDGSVYREIEAAASDLTDYAKGEFSGVSISGEYSSSSGADVISLLQLYLPMLANRQIVIDGEALVGATASAYDQSFGNRSVYAERGLAI